MEMMTGPELPEAIRRLKKEERLWGAQKPFLSVLAAVILLHDWPVGEAA